MFGDASKSYLPEETPLIERHANHRISFNITLFMVGAFATAAGGSPNHIALTALAAVWSIGVGGNLPVDSSIFLGKQTSSHRPCKSHIPLF